MSIVDQLMADPQIAGLLVAALIIIAVIGRYLGPDADWIDARKIEFAPKLNPVGRLFGRPFVNEVDLIDEFHASTRITPDALDEVWHRQGFGRSIASTVKYRVLPDGTKQYAKRQWVYRASPTAEMQQHVYVFDSHREGYESDVYTHREANTTDPEDHDGGDKQVPGDPEGIVQAALSSRPVDRTSVIPPAFKSE